MNLRTGVLGMLALIFSGSAALGVYLFTGKPANSGVETVSIVVAVGQVPRGMTLTEDMLTTRDWPQDFVPDGALFQLEEVVGRTVWIPLVENDPIVVSKLATLGAGRGMAALIPKGMRAITIQTPNVATGVAGFILPGNKVDVLWTISQTRQDDQTGGGSTVTLLQNVEILAVDQQIEVPNENRVDPRDLRSVTLLTTPADASKLDLAQNKGTLRLSLRNPEDALIDDIEMATLLGMRGSSPALVVQAPDPPDTDSADAEVAEVAEVAEAPPSVSRPREIVVPIRTLRGTSSGAVYLRQYLAPPSPEAEVRIETAQQP
jgi:pilus assembly protein CpaB